MDRYGTWLDASDAEALVGTPAAVPLVVEPVGLAVNNARNEGPELVVPVGIGTDGTV
jgi:putative SOS response-associated peptidase YedK